MSDNKRAADSCVLISRMMLPEDANPAGIVHGGVIMKEIDNAAGVAAIRHAHKICVTASIDRLDFHNPTFIGNLVTIKASVNMTGNTSMEIGVRVDAEDLMSGTRVHIASAYLTFVALGDDKRPAKVPPLIPTTPEEIRRHREAVTRRQVRLAEKKREVACQSGSKA